MPNENDLRDPASASPSRLGKASVVQGTIGLVIIACVACLWIAMETTTDEDLQNRMWVYVNVTALGGLGVTALLGLVGSCCAVAGLLRKNRRRGMLVVGLLLNGIILFVSALALFGLFSMYAGLTAG